VRPILIGLAVAGLWTYTGICQALGAALPESDVGDASSEKMTCTPNPLRIGDVLKIGLPGGHGGDFAIVAPDGEYYFLAFSQPDPSSPLQPVIETEAFRAMTGTELHTGEARGIPWSVEGAVTAEPIFTGPGTYILLVSAALETEDPLLDGWCRVQIMPGS
jgi:hypothetical protein